MGLIFWYLLALAIIVAWTLVVMAIWARWKVPLEKRNIVCMGPFIMWKTQKGKELIERVAEKRARLVSAYGRMSVGLTGTAMVTMTFFLFLSAYLVILRAKDLDLEPHMLLGLPGLNPIIPLWYGIFGLVVAMVVHEFSHGILTALAKVKVVSLGVMFFIFPMGAFVEPDEKGILETEKKNRVRMYASGPAANIIVAAVFALIFSTVLMGSVTVAHPGVGITNVSPDTPAEIYGLQEGWIMISIDQTVLVDYGDFSDAMDNTTANQTVEVGIYDPASDTIFVVPVNLTDRMLVTNDTGDAGMGYMGVYTMTVSDDFFHPIASSQDMGDFVKYASLYVTLPLQRLSPVEGTTAGFYEITGFWSFLPDGAFWVLANASYWIFWLNLMVGLSNALPAVPLDGGFIFKDWLDTFLQRFEKYGAEENRKKAVDQIAFVLALTILFLILWQVIGPRLVT